MLLVFGGLFAAADTVFAHLLSSSVPSLGSLPAHAAIAAGIAWLSAGLLRDLAARRDDERVLSADRLLDRVRAPRVGATEIGVVLAGLDLLFLTFVLVQARYLFGGSALVEAHAHLTYAQYARHGFFELVVVWSSCCRCSLRRTCSCARGSCGCSRRCSSRSSSSSRCRRCSGSGLR